MSIWYNGDPSPEKLSEKARKMCFVYFFPILSQTIKRNKVSGSHDQCSQEGRQRRRSPGGKYMYKMGAFFLCGQSFLSMWEPFSPCGGSLSLYVVGEGGHFWSPP